VLILFVSHCSTHDIDILDVLQANNRNDNFGWGVSISGDTIVVGASSEDSDAKNAGAAYVYVRNGTAWTPQAHLRASNTEAGDSFGYSVSISEDTIVVGAQHEDSNTTEVDNTHATSSGAACVFVRNGTTWTQQAYLKASNTGAGDNFGWSVSISGDTIVVGAWHEDSNATGVNGDQDNDYAPDSGQHMCL
jgi:hypothetical protein